MIVYWRFTRRVRSGVADDERVEERLYLLLDGCILDKLALFVYCRRRAKAETNTRLSNESIKV